MKGFSKLFFFVFAILLFVAVKPNFAQIGQGAGSFLYSGYKPLADKPVKVWYYSPVEDPAGLPIVFVMHGVKRNGSDYRDNWILLAQEHNLLIVVPEYSQEHYPKSRSYNLGNMFDSNGLSIEEKKWSYSIIEPLFDYIKAVINGKQKSYALFGHSAGAQFVHRFLLFKPENRAEVIISANAGWYTLPDLKTAFPYGIKNTTATSKSLAKSFAKRLIVLLGQADTNTQDKHLRKTKEAMAQGSNRFERGRYFYRKSILTADEIGAEFNWELEIVPGVGHQNAKMAGAAIKFIAPIAAFKKDG